MALVGAQFVNAVSPNPVGSLQAFAGASAPTGWLLCDGTSYSTSVYPELFSVLGYTYGGSGANFNVPDLRGRIPMGAGTGAQNGGSGSGVITGGTALTARTIGQFGGDERLATHNHGVTDPGHTHGHYEEFGNNNVNVGPGGNYSTHGGYGPYYGRNTTNTTGISIQNNANGGSGGNMPPFLVTNYIIKAVPDAPRSGLAYGSTPPIVTALPANPQFGDVVTYIADATNGVAWNLQYDASGTYPWKFIGGAPLGTQHDNGTQYTLTHAISTYADILTTTVPLAGDYSVQGASLLTTNSGCDAIVCLNTTASRNINYYVARSAGGGTQYENGCRTIRMNALAASTVVSLADYHVAVGSGSTVGNASLYVTPVRVKAA